MSVVVAAFLCHVNQIVQFVGHPIQFTETSLYKNAKLNTKIGMMTMNSRRTFFKTLALSVAAISSANILVPAFADSYKWKRTGQWLYVINPEYVDAPYEICGLSWDAPKDLAVCRDMQLRDFTTHRLPIHIFPYRYSDASGTISIPPIVKKFVTEPYYSL